jgi:flagellar biosynthesis/type III secretory pathway M-ring protein FliF/YscJ
MALSVGEDVIAVGLTWFATTHPIVAAMITLAFLIVIVVVIRFIIRAMRRLFRGAERAIAG